MKDTYLPSLFVATTGSSIKQNNHYKSDGRRDLFRLFSVGPVVEAQWRSLTDYSTTVPVRMSEQTPRSEFEKPSRHETKRWKARVDSLEEGWNNGGFE